MKINCIIIEDEPLAMERTRQYVEKLPFLNLLGTFDNGISALDFLRKQVVELIFLDIQMDELSGIQLLESAKLSSQVIITSAYDAYALKGYELNVTDYLLKPYSLERFIQAVDKARIQIEKQEPVSPRKFIFIKTEYRLEKLMLDELLYIEGMGDYRRIHTANKRIMTLQTFKDIEQEVPAGLICRVHKSYMVSLEKIDSVERDRIRIGDVIIPISDTYKKQFFELINYAPK